MAVKSPNEIATNAAHFLDTGAFLRRLRKPYAVDLARVGKPPAQDDAA
jgi:hypothetical protein